MSRRTRSGEPTPARRWAVVAVAITLAGTAACSEPPQAPAPSTTTSVSTAPNVYDQQRTAGVSATLTALSKAILDGNTARIDELLDPSATPEFRAALHTAAANLALPAADRERRDQSSVSGTAEPSGTGESSAPESSTAEPSPTSTPLERGTGLRLVRFDYQVAPTEEAETLVPQEIQQRLDAAGSSDSWVAPVELHYALGGAALPGINEPEITVDSQMIMARYDDSWRVVGDAAALDPSATGTSPSAQLWDLPGLAASDIATAGGTSVVASYPDTAATVARVRELLPGAVDAVSDFWGGQWARRAVVVPTADDRQFRALVVTSATGVGDAAAATVFDRIDTSEHVALGQRIVLTPGVADLPTPALGVVLRHELTHVAARGVTSPGAPLWVSEGVPEYVGRRGTYVRLADAAPGLAQAVRSGAVPADLPPNRDFVLDSAGTQLAYESAWSVAAYVADRYGTGKLKDLYLGVAGTDDAKRQDAAISRAIGVDRARLVRDWQGWLREQLR